MDKQVTILTVDDKPANIYALEKLLEKPNRIFLSATNGKDGLNIALNNTIDLIILDVQMPDMDGFEVAQILKSNKRTKDIPIIFASAEKREQHFIIKGFEEGAIDYLSKPLNPEITKAKVSVLLKLQMQNKELTEKNISLEKAEAQIKNLNADLQRNIIQLEATNKELESFSYSVSHDLRAPLRALSGYSKILEEDYTNTLDDGAKKILNTIQNNIIKMENLIEDLLRLSSFSKREIEKSEVSMDNLVSRVVEEMKITNHHANITLNSLSPAMADYALITQVWINLISNAIKYSSKKDNSTVEIGSRTEEDDIVYYVKDNGAGFDPLYTYKLFGVFQRLHKASEFEGTGVGLAIVQRIIVKHGGRVWAESAPNMGATFFFSLPNKFN